MFCVLYRTASVLRLVDKISSELQHLCVTANGEASLADGAISGHILYPVLKLLTTLLSIRDYVKSDGTFNCLVVGIAQRAVLLALGYCITERRHCSYGLQQCYTQY